MESSISSSSKQDGHRVANQKTEFERLSRELAERELELATLENELSAFEKRYARTVGILFAELDLLEREIARELLRLHPEEKYRQGFQRAEKKASASQEAVNEKTRQAEKQAYIPTEEIKNLYRKVAKTIHPDLAVNEAERAFRTDLMARANAAYKIGDKQALEQILYEWEHRDEKSFLQEEGSKESEHLEQKIAQIKRRMQEIETRIEELKNSDLYQLLGKVEQAARHGRDLLDDMAKDLRRQILEATKLLNSLKQQE
jgi:tetrahydromethanopterin S-methyltransferase subunit G